MNWYKINQQKEYLGYKIVGIDNKTKKTYSLYDKSFITISLNEEKEYSGKGLYLGNSKEYCLNYFACGTPDEDGELILTYKYDPKFLIEGDPNYKNGEIAVSKATLINIEILDKKEWCG